LQEAISLNTFTQQAQTPPVWICCGTRWSLSLSRRQMMWVWL